MKKKNEWKEEEEEEKDGRGNGWGGGGEVVEEEVHFRILPHIIVPEISQLSEHHKEKHPQIPTFVCVSKKLSKFCSA